jgi:hypothetical protein
MLEQTAFWHYLVSYWFLFSLGFYLGITLTRSSK